MSPRVSQHRQETKTFFFLNSRLPQALGCYTKSNLSTLHFLNLGKADQFYQYRNNLPIWKHLLFSSRGQNWKEKRIKIDNCWYWLMGRTQSVPMYHFSAPASLNWIHFLSPHSHILSHSLFHSLSLSHSHSRPLTHSHYHSLSLSTLSLPFTFTHSLTLIHWSQIKVWESSKKRHSSELKWVVFQKEWKTDPQISIWSKVRRYENEISIQWIFNFPIMWKVPHKQIPHSPFASYFQRL